MSVAATGRPPRLAFIVTEDWFFASHFLPMVAAARAAGFEPVVITRVRDHRAAIEATGATVVPLEAERRKLDPMSVFRNIGDLSRVLRRNEIAAVHCISLRPILIGGVAAVLAGVRRRILALTGGGFVAARQDMRARLSRTAIRLFVRHGLETPQTRYVFENVSDPGAFGLSAGDRRVTILGGAGVDPAVLFPQQAPPMPPLRVAVVCRMLWSKGVDLAADAVSTARAAGHDVRLSLYGAPDASNPRAISRETLEEWASRDGIEWHGPTRDIAAVWASHQLCCLPSRGGEGLPRTLLEAAACGRAILTTDVPGCRDLVRDGVEGWLVPPGDSRALAERLAMLAADPARLEAAGVEARRRILEGYTQAHIVAAMTQLYRTLVPNDARQKN